MPSSEHEAIDTMLESREAVERIGSFVAERAS
jgi:hypothetical protein